MGNEAGDNMIAKKAEPKLVLEGFNNISKSLTASFYHIVYTPSTAAQETFLAACNRYFSAEYLTSLLHKISQTIGATVLFASKNTYAPLGASAAMLIAEGATDVPVNGLISEDDATTIAPELSTPVKTHHTKTEIMPKGISEPSQPRSQSHSTSQLFHLDKSHMAAHTYPESHPKLRYATFRIDLDLSTCGDVNPLHALNPLLSALAPDVFTLDLRLRGFTRDRNGNHCFNDNVITQFTPFISPTYQKLYMLKEILLEHERVFILKGRLEDFTTKQTPAHSGELMSLPFKPPLSADSEKLSLVLTEARKIFEQH